MPDDKSPAAPAPAAPAPAATRPVPDPWAGLLAMVGLGLVVVVATQVLGGLAQTLSFDASRNQPSGVPTDFLHRLGFPFGALGPATLALLVPGLAMLLVPDLLKRPVTKNQASAIQIGLVVVMVLSVVLAVGSLLAVRNSLHEYANRVGPAPTFIRLQTVIFLLGSLGPAVVSLCGSIVAFRHRRQTSPH